MPRYEVFVPASPPALPMDLTLRIDAEHWLAALKTGLQKIGGPQMTANVLCDIQADGSIHVTDAQSSRVFRIQEVAAPAPATAAAPVAAAPPEPVPVPVPAPAAAPPPPVAPRRPSSQVTSVEQVAKPSAPPPAVIGRLKPSAPKPEDVLAELFEKVAEVADTKDLRKGLAFLLDLALEEIGCEAGSVFLGRLESQELEFAVARGPRADELLRLGLTVPMGVGVVGFCAQENVCLAVSDAQKDPRFYKAVSAAIGYETRSLLCAPLARHGRVRGALEVLNKRGGKAFDPQDLAVLSYLAHQAAELLARVEG